MNDREMTLFELIRLLRKHVRLVIGLPVVCAVACAIVCWGFLPNEYTAETSIYALTRGDSQATGSDGVTYGDLNASQMLANDFAELAQDDQIQKRTAEKLGMEDLDDYDISVVSSTTTRVIKVDVTGMDPDSAAVVANKLSTVLGNTAKSVMDVKAVNVISEAQPPTQPSGPSRTLYTVVAFLAGLFAAIVIVVVMDMMNTSIRNDEEASQLLDAPVIGRFPMEKEGRR